MTDQVAADEAQALPSELGIKEARGILGRLVRAAAAEQLTYLTIKGERIAAIVPAAAARTLAQSQTAAAELERLRAEHDQALAAAAELRYQVEALDAQARRLQRRMSELQAEHARKLGQHERWWANRYIELWRELEHRVRETGRQLDHERLGTLLTTFTSALALLNGLSGARRTR